MIAFHLFQGTARKGRAPLRRRPPRALPPPLHSPKPCKVSHPYYAPLILLMAPNKHQNTLKGRRKR